MDLRRTVEASPWYSRLHACSVSVIRHNQEIVERLRRCHIPDTWVVLRSSSRGFIKTSKQRRRSEWWEAKKENNVPSSNNAVHVPLFAMALTESKNSCSPLRWTLSKNIALFARRPFKSG